MGIGRIGLGIDQYLLDNRNGISKGDGINPENKLVVIVIGIMGKPIVFICSGIKYDAGYSWNSCSWPG